MLQLSPDMHFHFELLRNLSHARYSGSDISEVLSAASQITPSDFSSFHSVFNTLALHVLSQASQIDSSKYPISARDAYFRASTYFRAADFYLHGNPSDPRINQLLDQQIIAFDKAITLLPQPGRRILLRGEGFDIPAIFFPAGNNDDGVKKPTVIIGTGYDGAQEELLHICGFAALPRGYNVITYEGPGHPTVRRTQSLGFITEWEKVVTPVVDYLLTLPEVDPARIGLIGFSMGGFLAVRAAAFEHRLAAVMAIDGVYDVGESFSNTLPPNLKALLSSPETHAKLNGILKSLLSNPSKAPTGLRWGIEQGFWAFNVNTPSELVEAAKKMTLKGLGDRIQCPVWVGEAEEDIFFKGQPEKVKEELGEKATLVRLGREDAAESHCHVGAGVLMNQRVFDWFGEVISKN
jgi:pimeloyl-ACP methyl ester carboxylesterase